MQQALGDFIHVLRQGGIPVSPSETLDAINTVNLLGLTDRRQLKHALGLTVAKTQEHKREFNRLFDRFFSFEEGDSATPESSLGQDEQDIKESENSITEQSINELTDDPLSAQDQLALNSELAQQLMSGNTSDTSMAIAAAGSDVGVTQMKVFTQQPLFAFRIMQQLGVDALNSELSELAQDESNSGLVQALTERRNALRERVATYVQQQFELFAQAEGKKLRDSNLRRISFTNVEYQNYDQMSALVRKAAKQLARLHSRRRKITKRGLLDVRKTISANAAFDGALFHTKWKSTKIDRPKVMAICDVSGSVSRVARFLLLFLYCLQDVLPRTRSFAFSGELGEVTSYFEEDDMDLAFAKVMDEWANRSTDYGKSLANFERLALDQIDNKTTVIMLGDARNNNGDGNIKVWEQVYRRSNRVLWLNPERQGSWDTGDSIMREYSPYCSRVETCNSLRDLTRILNSLLKHS